jgi:hypothetical protein
MSSVATDLGLIAEVGRLQAAENERARNMTPEERQADAAEQLRFIAHEEWAYSGHHWAHDTATCPYCS